MWPARTEFMLVMAPQELVAASAGEVTSPMAATTANGANQEYLLRTIPKLSIGSGSAVGSPDAFGPTVRSSAGLCCRVRRRRRAAG